MSASANSDAMAATVAPTSPMSGSVSYRGADAHDDFERALVTLVAQRDEVAFRELYARYCRRIARFASRITTRSEVCGEIVNDTLWAVWNGAGRFRGASKVSTWILGIACHISHKALRNTIYRPAPCEFPPDITAPTHEPWSRDEALEWLAAGLAQLPAPQRNVLELAYLCGYSCQEIAQSVNCPVNTVKTRMFHGRRKLKLLLPHLAALQ